MQPTTKSSMSVKDKLEGNKLDLSLLEITDVPVKEMALVTRGTDVDLSNNKISSLPMTFPSLIHIVKLDLSKNQLTSLPPNFGELRNLKQLDLYSNKLERVPVSFYQLKELRWLDLKNNPLVPTLAEAAGKCVDSKECYDAAKKVVKLMTMVHIELEKKRLQEQEATKARLMAQQVEANREKEDLRLQKKAAKEKRRAEANSKQPTAPVEPTPEIRTVKNELGKGSRTQRTSNRSSHRSPQPRNTGSSWCGCLMGMLLRIVMLGLLLSCSIVAWHWEGPLTYDNLVVVSRQTWLDLQRYYVEVKEWSGPYVRDMQQQWKQLSRFMAENGQDMLDAAWHEIIIWAGILHKQGLILWGIAGEKGSEWLTIAYTQADLYWQLICQKVPIYYDLALHQIQSMYNSTLAAMAN